MRLDHKMSCSFRAKLDGLLIETSWVGELTSESVVRCAEQRIEWINNSCLEKPRVFLDDFSNASAEKLTPEDLRGFVTSAQEYRELYTSLVQVFLAPGDLAFGLGRMWQVYSKDIMKCHIVRTRHEAERLIKEYEIRETNQLIMD